MDETTYSRRGKTAQATFIVAWVAAPLLHIVAWAVKMRENKKKIFFKKIYFGVKFLSDFDEKKNNLNYFL